MIRKLFFIIPFVALLVTSCAQKKTKDTEYLITINTSEGVMVAILYDETPKHKENFIKLAKEHYFDSTVFHRVIEGFMIQGGDPNSKRAKPDQRLGSDGPGYTLEAEFNPKFIHEKGTIAAARMVDERNPTKASNGSQFYIVHGRVIPEGDFDDLKINQNALGQAFRQFATNPANKPVIDSLRDLYNANDVQSHQRKVISLIPRIEKETGLKIMKDFSPEQIQTYSTIGGAPHLDGEYTIFGKVIKGLDVVDKIARLPKDEYERPIDNVRMFVTVDIVSKKKITKEYGYVFPDQK